MKIDGLGKSAAVEPPVIGDKVAKVLEDYLYETRVTMGDGSISNRVCSLCIGNVIPGLDAANECVCHRTRELLGGYRKQSR